jgi:predicted transcriptional regulator
MFLHLGQDTVILTDEIIGIFDLDTTTVSKTTRDYLTKMEKSGKVINVSSDLPKSFILVRNKKTGDKKIYISPISTQTILKRIENINYLVQN